MKKGVVIFFGLIVLIAGCKKDNAIKSLQQELSGKWELTKITGGLAGTTTEYPPGNGNFISFAGNGFTKNIAINDTVYNVVGTFNIYTGKPCDNVPETTLIELHDYLSSSSYGYKNEIILSNGELSLSDTPCIADGITSFYREIK